LYFSKLVEFHKLIDQTRISKYTTPTQFMVLMSSGKLRASKKEKVLSARDV